MEEDEHIFGWLVGTPPIPPVWKTLKSALKPDSTYHVQILSWKLLSLIYHSATSCWLLKEDNFYLNKFLKTMDNVLIVTENKSLLWNYSYSDKSSFFYLNPTIAIVKATKYLMNPTEWTNCKKTVEIFISNC